MYCLPCEQPIEPDDSIDSGYPVWSVTLVALLGDAGNGTEQAETLGGAEVVLCRNARWDRSFWARLDETSRDVEIFGSALSRTGEAADDALFETGALSGDVLLVDRVWIESEARGNALSHMLIDAAAKIISPEAVLAIIPMPLDQQDEISIRLLQRHWGRSGFVPYRDGVYVKRQVPLFADS